MRSKPAKGRRGHRTREQVSKLQRAVTYVVVSSTPKGGPASAHAGRWAATEARYLLVDKKTTSVAKPVFAGVSRAGTKTAHNVSFATAEGGQMGRDARGRDVRRSWLGRGGHGK